MKLLKRLLKYAKPYTLLFVLAILVVISLTFVTLLPPQIVRNTVNNYITNDSLPLNERFSGIFKMSLYFLLTTSMIFVFEYISIYITTYLGGKIVYDIRKELFDHVLKLPMSFFDKHPSGQITTRIANDTQNIMEFFTSVITSIFNDVFLLTGVIIMMLRVSPRLFANISFVFPVLIVSMILFRYFDLKAYRAVRTNISKVNAYLAEHIAGMPVVKLFNAEDFERKNFDKVNKELYKSRIQQMYVFAIFRPTVSTLYRLAIAAIIWMGAKYIVSKTLNFGDLYAFVAYLELFMRPLEDLSEKYDIIQNTVASAEKIFTLMDETEEHFGDENGKVEIEKGVVEFKNVWFRYNEDRWILKNINLKFEPGQLIAVVGETGAGKTSLMNLVNGMYRIQKGKILIDGTELEKYNIHELRKQISTVPQDVVLFSGTLLDNVRLFHEEISEDQVIDALKKVYVWDLIERLPNGLYTEVIERGKGISAGERQLIALARSVLFDAKIFILDEATSNIDVQTEERIQKAVRKLSENKTVIMIAHRLATVVNADKIYVVHKGEVVEEGSHKELLNKKGIYYKLYEVQFSK
ncbi:ABC transporter ATP-binding protein [Thermosipho africanus Ob7]|jgi:ATP-binding cassette subfamily C protein|uniref:ABC transporter ATP-binding protein n=1 Tax=Thermosipho TaxID=2420 RepID=UPI000E0C97D6|nr:MULTISPECIES: ABC transporter ATP-binding protein [Thermosipho]MBZ4650318.1 transporter, ATP-binding protein [Thermosipho sp. (in: thermotogales)]MDK2839736.1 ATP-binding cassette, subfamily multidrug efflux pump [Thermosipho sp. (in: thermotogales)]MDK2900848.1 ATP-binding cassette, subfamily multidrug efflux pump [Thermosipho sp. (in: thermotogales)]RDI91725.1 ABC transporter ATP-binding protein [Thermosipho africanus Ob7]